MVRRVHTRRSRRAASRVVTTPASTSECPARYFVALCQARSAPRSSGRCRSGVANVLSQHRSAPPACASLAAPAMSVSVTQWIGRSLDDRERGAVAGAAEAVAIAGVEAPHLHAEALQDPGREALEAVVAAGRQCQGAALSEERQADARPGRHAAREDCRLGVFERAQQRLGLGGYGRVPASVGRASARLALEGRRAIERRREPTRGVVDETADEQGVGLHGPKHSSPRQAVSRLARPSMPASRHHSAAESAASEASSGIVMATSRRIVATSR